MKEEDLLEDEGALLNLFLRNMGGRENESQRKQRVME
jgi:hypothetical protein